MKRLLISTVFLCLLNSHSFSQKLDTLGLKVQKILELRDCFIFEGICENKATVDTIFVLSEKCDSMLNSNYEKIKIGQKYQFIVSDVTGNLAAVPPENFVLRIKNTVVWRSKDGMKKIPFFAKNTQGLFIQKNSDRLNVH